jgi:hypothetical protein
LEDFLWRLLGGMWPDLLANVLVASAGPLLRRRWGIRGLLIGVAEAWTADVLIYWLRVRALVVQDPVAYRLISAAESLVWLGLTGVVVLVAVRFTRSQAMQVALAVLAVVVLSPLVLLAFLAVSCSVGNCL